MNQSELVEKTGISVPTMQRLMAGRTRFTIEQVLAISAAIGGKTAAEFVDEAEALAASRADDHQVSGDGANVTRISTKRGSDAWQGEQHALDNWDAAAKPSNTVIEIAPDDVTP